MTSRRVAPMILLGAAMPFLTGCEDSLPRTDVDVVPEEWFADAAAQADAHRAGATCDETPPTSVVSLAGVRYSPKLITPPDSILSGGAWFQTENTPQVAWGLDREIWSVAGDASDTCYRQSTDGDVEPAYAASQSGEWFLVLTSPRLSELDLPVVRFPDVYADGGPLRRDDGEYSARRLEDGTAFAWSCTDALAGPTALEPELSRAGAHGVVFVHAEPDDGRMVDLWLVFDHIDCAWAEDAGRRDDAGRYVDCDGIDNDVDGDIDEGMIDTDGNGVVDCGAAAP